MNHQLELPALGCSIDQLDTPLLCVELDVMERNIHLLTARCREAGVGWRPHTKCHKSPPIARMLLQAGAHGMTCAKLGEAEVMAEGGIEDILIANMVVGERKLSRLHRLRSFADPMVCVDHGDQIQAFADTFRDGSRRLRLLIEVDLGLERVGCQPGAAVKHLAREIEAAPGLQLAGIMGYEGHLLCLEDPHEKARQIHAALQLLVEQKGLLEADGIECPIVSCGGTGSFEYAVREPGITELQAGGGIFMDAFYRHRCRVEQWDFALTVLTTIVSRPTAERAIIDAGRKTMDANHHRPLVVGRDDIEVVRLSAEHGELRLEGDAQRLKIGDRLQIIPGYSDMTCVLHDHLYGIRNRCLEVVWPIAGRGRLQ